MNYQLSNTAEKGKKEPILRSLQKLVSLMSGERKNLIITGISVIFSSGTTLLAPIIIGSTIDHAISKWDYQLILTNAALLFLIYCIGWIASYIQTKTMGGVGRRTLFLLRNQLFTKIQELPIAFFNQNKTGDLISRINNDTDKLNQFFAQAFTQFLSNFFLIAGSGIFIVFLSPELWWAALLPALIILLATEMLSPWVQRKNLASLQSTGGMSGEIQESLANFKVITAFNRMDYFTQKFEEYNNRNYTASIQAGIASNIFTPLYTFVSNLAQLIVLVFGIYLIMKGDITIGLFISFQFYLNNFYSPLRQLASVWSSLQLALASLDRIMEVLSKKSDMKILPAPKNPISSDVILEFRDVSFGYPDGKTVLKNVNFSMKKWKTYALVGPTGWGKTTTASLIARLYDPTTGIVLLEWQDIRTFDAASRAGKVGFILQEPFLFTGTVRENILYGNDLSTDMTDDQIKKLLDDMWLLELLEKFDAGLDTQVSTSGESISLGQKQLLAFMRAILKSPDILILDEATANIDTVTEELLESMLAKLPKTTTKVIIAHRLNTIDNADEIFFVNGGSVTNTGSMQNALDMILHGKRES